MGSLGNPKPWVPYGNTNDCSQGYCSLYCPQWCYLVFPPPPPLEFPGGSSGPNFSPLLIAIIGILASAFLLVSYYAIISKYCGNMDSPRRRENRDPSEELEESDDPSNHEPWHVATTGLDEALIKSIAVCKYKKGDGLIEGTDCSVCLSEFEEDESLRLLPKCSHAFHVACIDMWLKSHSNCPLCRANIIFVHAAPIQLLSPVTELGPPPNNESSSDEENPVVTENTEMGYRDEEILLGDEAPKTQLRAMSNLGNSEERDIIIEIRDEDDQRIRRSVSMDYLCQRQVFSIADALSVKQDEDYQMEVGSSKQLGIGVSKSMHRSCRALHCVTSPVSMKRSFSSGRFLFSRRGRGRNLLLSM
ncbi:RING-H2 finger protein ATL52-like [Actinidia eriantha]|uniref:RING-H2 finger protein ATL52-like n=1 Tax=Actinidia eriantha TaxID=165200 RepID=UPI0025864715|nr:RING-H2 finger protein ATL52-like [Actinidia eriantha]